MNLYRLDYIDSDGRDLAAVPDRLLGGAWITRNAKAARTLAIDLCDLGPEGARGVAVTRISGAGHMKRMLIVNPTGRVTRAA